MLTSCELQLGRSQQHLSEPLTRDVRLQNQREPQNDPLVTPGWRWRHEELAVDQLVARRGAFSLLDEAVDIGGRPAVSANDGHGHNLLGGRIETQLGMSERSSAVSYHRHPCSPRRSVRSQLGRTDEHPTASSPPRSPVRQSAPSPHTPPPSDARRRSTARSSFLGAHPPSRCESRNTPRPPCRIRRIHALRATIFGAGSSPFFHG